MHQLRASRVQFAPRRRGRDARNPHRLHSMRQRCDIPRMSCMRHRWGFNWFTAQPRKRGSGLGLARCSWEHPVDGSASPVLQHRGAEVVPVEFENTYFLPAAALARPHCGSGTAALEIRDWWSARKAGIVALCASVPASWRRSVSIKPAPPCGPLKRVSCCTRSRLVDVRKHVGRALCRVLSRSNIQWRRLFCSVLFA